MCSVIVHSYGCAEFTWRVILLVCDVRYSERMEKHQGVVAPQLSRDQRQSGPMPLAWLAIGVAVFAVAWGGNQYTPMLVFYRGEGFFSELFIDMMLVVYAAGIAVGLLLAGPMSDRYGRKKVMLPTPAFAALGSILIALGEHNDVLMTAGRTIAGISVGIAMTAGGSWIKELSRQPFDPTAKPTSGAKRASMSLTAGFTLSAGVAGTMAQWLPWPAVLPFAVHVGLTALGTLLILRLPETRFSTRMNERGGFLKDLAIPSLKSPRFLVVVAPMAPWVFGAAFTSHAILPAQIRHLSDHPIALTALISLLTLGSGFVIQQFAPQIVGNSRRRGPLVALTVTVIGMSLATIDVMHPTIAFTLVCAVVLGTAYGLTAYVGLSETQAIATDDDMAGLTGIFYCLTYLGMVFPAVLTMLGTFFTYPQMLGGGVVIALVTLAMTTVTAKRL